MIDELEPCEPLDCLTDKQKEVLDLLVQHMTTKEIARELGIAANTVDQRISGVRQKWGTRDKNETARHYARLLELCERSPCGFSQVDPAPRVDPRTDADLPRSPVFQLNDVGSHADFARWTGDPEGPEALDARIGKVWRIAAIPLLAVLLGMVMIWALAFADQLGDLL